MIRVWEAFLPPATARRLLRGMLSPAHKSSLFLRRTEVTDPVMIDIDGDEHARVQHLLVSVGSQSAATVVINHRGGGQGALNQTVEIEAGDASDLTIVSIQEWDDSLRTRIESPHCDWTRCKGSPHRG